jgi:hypothetical protein
MLKRILAGSEKQMTALQSLTGKVQVFYRDLPVKYSTPRTATDMDGTLPH